MQSKTAHCLGRPQPSKHDFKQHEPYLCSDLKGFLFFIRDSGEAESQD